MQTAILETDDEKQDTREIMQLSFFDDVTEEDIRKTKWLLRRYTDMIDICKNYEIAQKEMQNGLSAYELLCAEGTVARKESPEDTYSNIPVNALVLKDKRHVIYLFYKRITNIIRQVVANIRDPHEALIARLLFLEGMRYLKAQEYLEKGYRKDIYPISATTFAEKRRKAIANIANSLKINGTLDFVVIDYGRGRNKEGEIGLRLPT